VFLFSYNVEVKLMGFQIINDRLNVLSMISCCFFFIFVVKVFNSVNV